MKKLFLLSVLIMLFALTTNAQTPYPKFLTTTHDFGSIGEDSGTVTTRFEFTNDGDAPLIIKWISASCGCTTSDWTREPIPPKGKGFINVSYNPKGRPGVFTKTISVRSNSSDQPIALQVKGTVTSTM
ncbi:DUF1573 domain-containing protein [Dysgonomonas sp. 521]|uniref:DUF1573 domain-containing protein n=1 Tax=Dysgonomonas sp. 521 TaxID=2302932 RepID=UPI0013D2BE50|nr:DUF1573 domain-containing protein [Dysgonomonas sp. 521]NDV97596.1 DUF1573 domain-containing protein [Dysgonomonas sp. 521]